MHSFETSDAGDTKVNIKTLNKENKAVKIIKNHSLDDAFLDLSSRALQIIPDQLFHLPHIQHLYLEGNLINQLPSNFFDRLPALQWLDLRNNQLKSIPVSVGRHQSLKTLLLEGNQLTQLPLQMGLTKSLTGLNLRGNPLVVPPAHIIDQGVFVILSYLWQELQNRKNSNDVLVAPTVEKLSIIEDESISSEEEETDDVNFTGRNIPSPMSDDFELVRHGPTPMSASLHKPIGYQEYKGRYQGNSLLEGLRNKSRGSPKDLSLIDIRHTDATRKDQLKQMRQIKQINEDQRKKDKTALSVWRNETKRRQRLPRSKTADVTWKPPPFASNEQLVVHNEVREEKVETILPGEHKLRLKNSDTHKRSHMIVEIPNAMNEAILPEPVVEQVPKEGKVDDYEPKMSRPNSVARNRTNDEILQRMKQHSSQIHKQIQQQRSEAQTAPSRELQRQLLDRKMSKDDQLEYRFKAFTGDSVSGSSNKTSLS